MLQISRLLLVSVLAWNVLAQMDTGSDDICTPQGYSYRQIAIEVLENLKYQISPCDDFYRFACGRFIENAQIPEGSDYLDGYTHVTDILSQQKVDMITKERPETDPKHLKFLYKFLKSCTNTMLINELGDEPIQQISNSLGGWPVVVGNSWDSDNSWSWQGLAKKLRRLGFSTDYILTFHVGDDLKDNTRNIIYLYQPTLFRSEFYDTSLITYLDFMVNVAIHFGAQRAAAISELRKVLHFEEKLAYISKRHSNVDYVDNLVTIKQLQELYPYIQWLDLINGLLPEGLTVDENEEINLLAPSFFDKLGNLLAHTDKRTIANYIMWKFHYFSMKYLSQEFREQRNQFDTFVLRAPPQEGVLYECYLIAVQRTTVTQIFENVRNAFNQTLDESEWLDDKTKAEARKKLYSMRAIIGFPDEMFDVERVEEYYRDLEIDQTNYFQSYLNIKAFDLDKELHQLRISSNETEWLNYNIDRLDGFINELEGNRLYIPATFLQGQFFNTQRPNYMNYGSLGTIIAHEIIHGFCGAGCKYCADGGEGEWWQPASKRALCERQNCLVEQYNNYTDKQTGLEINGFQTLDENISDNSGVKLSYLAYRQLQSTHGKEPKLPGMNYTPQQLFWISFAQNYCGKFTTDELIDRITTDVHSTHEFRVIGVVSNMKDFSRDFQCPKNSPMNPEQKCEVW